MLSGTLLGVAYENVSRECTHYLPAPDPVGKDNGASRVTRVPHLYMGYENMN